MGGSLLIWAQNPSLFLRPREYGVKTTITRRDVLLYTLRLDIGGEIFVFDSDTSEG